MSYISRACSSLVRQPYYAPNCFTLKISGLETILASEKGRLDGRTFYIDEYTLIFLFSQCIRCAQKRYCWESVRFASERSRVRIPLGPLKSACVITTQALFFLHLRETHAALWTQRDSNSTALPQAGQATSPVGCCLVRGSQSVGMSTWETFVFAASFCTMRRFLYLKKLGGPCRAPNPEVGCEPGGVINVLFENSSVSRFFL